MENYIVSARKYRPQTFEDVVGQKHITDTLMNEINSNHLAQAFLFTGPRGVGKTTCARILAKVINTDENTKENQDFSYNIFELDAASNNSVEDIRNLNDQVRIQPQIGKYKVYIIDEVHMLTTAAFNAFLKTLEEPPSYAIFILATTEKNKILPTILSRCQIFNFNRIRVNDMVSYLANIAKKENVTATNEALHIIAQKADGGLRDALSMFDQMVSFCEGEITYEKTIENLNLLDADYYFKITDALFAQDASSALLLLNEIIEKGFEGNQFLLGLNDHLRNLMMVKDTQTHLLLEVSENIQIKYLEQAKNVEYALLLNALNIAHRFDFEYKNANNKRLHIELCLMKINALPYLMNGEINKSEKAQVLEFKTTLYTKLKSVKKIDKPNPSNFSAITKSIINKGPQLISKEKIESLPVINESVIKNNLNNYKVADVVLEEIHENETPTGDIVQELTFSDENVRIVINELADYIVETLKRKSLAAFLKSQPFRLQENGIYYEFNAEIHKKHFEELNPLILEKLREKFVGVNPTIHFALNIVSTEAKSIYTPNTKFLEMLEKSAPLKKLVESLKLGVKGL